MKKRVCVIGAGVAGLSAGSYLAMNGYEVTIFERNRIVGGLCTAWQRGDYKVDLCIHWLPGVAPTSTLYSKWNELMPMREIEVKFLEDYLQVEDVSGRFMRLYTDVQKLKAELLEKAPEDREKILELVDSIEKLKHFDLPHEHAHELVSLWQRAKEFGSLLPYYGVLSRFMNMTLAEYASEFDNPLLQKTIFHAFEPDFPALFMLLNLALMSKKEAGYPIGGSMSFAQRIADHFIELGGSIEYEREVTRILVDDNQVVGVELAEGQQVYGDYVISAADGHNTLFELLEGQYLSHEFEEYYAKREIFPSLVFVALGVNKDLSGLPANILFPLHHSLVIDPSTIIDELLVHIHHYDSSLAPVGKTLITAAIETNDFNYWDRMPKEHPEKYQEQKKRIADALIQAIDLRFGAIADYVEMVDVATPSTIFHFSHNWKGSIEGWMLTPETLWKNLPHTLPKLKNFYMCGQWIAVGGGLPAVMLSGRDVAELVCTADHKTFETHPA